MVHAKNNDELMIHAGKKFENLKKKIVPFSK
jgi:hypothetical protein